MTMTMEPEALAGEAAISAELTLLADRARTLLDKAESDITATGPHGPARVTALALAIMELSPESTPGWVRGIGPALAPVADAMEALRAGTPDPTDLAIERVALILAAEDYTAPQIRAAAEGWETGLRIADAVERLEITVSEMAE